jgi:hypothetical protein
MPTNEEARLRAVAEKLGAKPDDSFEQVLAIIEESEVDLTQPAGEATKDQP